MLEETIKNEISKLLAKRKLYEKISKSIEDKEIQRGIEKDMEAHIRDEIKRLDAQLAVPVQFNIFQRIFSPKYRKYKKQMTQAKKRKTEMEEYLPFICVKSLKETIAKKKRQIQGISVDDIDSAIKALENETSRVNTLFKVNPELSNNVELMRELVNIDEYNVKYDNSNDSEIYLHVIKVVRNEIQDEEKAGEINEEIAIIPRVAELLDAIENRKHMQGGKWKVPFRTLYGKIRANIFEFEKDEKLAGDHQRLVRKSVINAFQHYISLNEKANEEIERGK